MTKQEINEVHARLAEFRKMTDEAKKICILEAVKRNLNTFDDPSDYSYVHRTAHGAALPYTKKDKSCCLITVEFEWYYNENYLPIWDINNPIIKV